MISRRGLFGVVASLATLPLAVRVAAQTNDGIALTNIPHPLKQFVYHEYINGRWRSGYAYLMPDGQLIHDDTRKWKPIRPFKSDLIDAPKAA